MGAERRTAALTINPEMASPYADALPDLAGPGRRALGQGARQKCVAFSEPWVLPENNVFSR